MENRSRFGNRIQVPKPAEKCPGCDAPIVLKVRDVNSQPQVCNPDGTEHVCAGEAPDFEPRPIGQAVNGAVIKDFDLRNRQLSITLDGGRVLKVYAGGKALRIWLMGPEGILED